MGRVPVVSKTPTAASFQDAYAVAAGLESEAGLVCQAKLASRTIMCAVDSNEREANRLARGVAFETNVHGVDLNGWKLTLITLDD